MMILRNRIIFLFFIFCLIFFSCVNKPYYKSTELLMGTFVEVTSDQAIAEKIVFDEIRRLDKLFNKFDPESEVSKLNKSGKLKVSQDTLEIIKLSQEFCQATNGAFDITVAPLVDVWKEAIKTKILPDKKKIKKAKSLAGFKNILIDEKNSTIKFLKKGMSIDLGGIAKGYAVDAAVKKLKEKGIKSCLVNNGGNMYCLGKKLNRDWKVGIKHPRKPDEMFDYLGLSDNAIATSGDYEQYFISGNKRYSHIIDPKTGYPANSGIISATIVAPDATTADVLGTAVLILGEEKGANLIKKYKDVQVIILKEIDGRIEKSTINFN